MKRMIREMPNTSRAAVFTAPNLPLLIQEFPLRALRPGEVLVRVRMATICRSDLHSYQGLRPSLCPGILGHEAIGHIVAMSGSVCRDLRGTMLEVGDRVTWTEYFCSGDPYYQHVLDMPQKCTGVKKYGHESAHQEPYLLGGFADYCYLQPGTGILSLPEGLSDEEATPLNCGVATMAAATEAACIGLGSTVVIQGLGLLGLYGASMAKALGARLVVGVDPVASRRDLASRFGADVALDPRSEAHRLEDRIRNLCRPDGADAVIEVAGVPEVIPIGLNLLRAGGRYVLAGVVNPGATVMIDANRILTRCLTLSGVHNYHPRHLLQALDFVVANRGRFPFRDLVDARYPLERIQDAFQDVARRKVLRAAIVPS